MRVGYLGPAGTYSYQAAVQHFPNANGEVEYLPQKSIGACFQSMNDGSVDYAIVPFENSTNGQVIFTFDLIVDWFVGGKANFQVVGEEYVAIHHALVGYAASINGIKEVHSHPQVWGQCRNILAKLESPIQVDESSTAAAVLAVSKLRSLSVAALAPLSAAHVHNVPIIQSPVEDDPSNTTRFLVLGRQHYSADRKIADKGMLLLAPHGDPSAPAGVARAMAELAARGVGVAGVTSRPLGNDVGNGVGKVFVVDCFDEEARGEEFAGRIAEAAQQIGIAIVAGVY